MRPKGSKDELELRRKSAIFLLSKGYTTTEIADVLECTPRSVLRWKATYDDGGGMKGLDKIPHCGRAGLLSSEQLQGLDQALLETPRKHGLDADCWTCARVRLLIEKKFSVSYTEAHISKLLRARGFSVQRLAKNDKRRREGEIASWVKTERKKVKKRPENVMRT